MIAARAGGQAVVAELQAPGAAAHFIADVAFLLSDDASFISGHSLALDGARLPRWPFTVSVTRSLSARTAGRALEQDTPGVATSVGR